ncbi:MAG TPA: hypothetical protein VHN11_04840 [Xanthobacteraceae bacterium]|jgi:hypothetical protein|nr:hypothetical protein [Xanthobacteraceae bacterium]
MTQFDRFKAYMDAPCHELHKKDAGRNDPHRLAFKEWGVPKEFLLWLWQAAEAGALERAAQMTSIYLLDHGIEQARECLPDAIRAMKDQP